MGMGWVGWRVEMGMGMGARVGEAMVMGEGGAAPVTSSPR